MPKNARRARRSDESTSCGQAQDLLAHSVSSSDLTAWWNGADAGETLMILDSCHSGAAAGKEFDPDHSGDPGLGQLRYDKGEVHGPNFDSDHSQEFVDVPEQDNILVRIKSSRSLWRWLTRSMISGGPSGQVRQGGSRPRKPTIRDLHFWTIYFPRPAGRRRNSESQ
jgi:hypothetical protein